MGSSSSSLDSTGEGILANNYTEDITMVVVTYYNVALETMPKSGEGLGVKWREVMPIR